MRKYEYSKDLVNIVKQFLVDDDWHFSFDENTGVFDFGLRVKSKIQKINYIVDVHEDEIVVYGMCPIGADHTDANMMAQMAEFLCRANYGLKNGCFELDFRDGEIRFRSFIDCEDLMPSTKVTMISEAVGEDMECTDIADMIERLAARLGITEDGEDESGEGLDDEGSSDEIRVNPFNNKKEGGAA